MKILALEFSFPLRSAAVLADGAVLGQSSEQGEPSAHPFKLIDAALRESGLGREEIECVVVGTGPGSYAGIRIAIAVAQGWQLARKIKLLGIGSAEGVAAQVAVGRYAEKFFSIGVDAQRDEIFIARYEVQSERPQLIAPFQRAEKADFERFAAGEVCFRPDILRTEENGMVALPPTAISLGQLALGRSDFVAAPDLEPIYLRKAEFVKAPPSKFRAD